MKGLEENIILVYLTLSRSSFTDQCTIKRKESESARVAGSSLLKSFAWPLKAKKRHRSGSGGSKEFEQKTKKSLSAHQQRKLTGSTFILSE